jgi:hypothetical protein
MDHDQDATMTATMPRKRGLTTPLVSLLLVSLLMMSLL